MSEPSRAQRRRGERGGSTTPKKRDPMVPVYTGLAILLVLVFAGFGIANWLAGNARAKAIAFDQSTPTPGPAPTQKPIPVKDLQTVGTPTGFPVPNAQKGILSDTKAGGQNQPVDGIPCETSEQVAMHVHGHLALIVNGKTVQIPPYIGMAPNGTGGCLYWLHTHDASGIIHVEAGDVSAPNGGPFTLGMFFDIWGQPLTRTQAGPFNGPVTAYVNGASYTGDLKAIPLRSHQVITLEVGSPVIPPPNYQIPKTD
ncbi:MAG: hypothetical protein ABR508_09470 [Candidatus Baltobacteraceae bacterium]